MILRRTSPILVTDLPHNPSPIQKRQTSWNVFVADTRPPRLLTIDELGEFLAGQKRRQAAVIREFVDVPEVVTLKTEGGDCVVRLLKLINQNETRRRTSKS